MNKPYSKAINSLTREGLIIMSILLWIIFGLIAGWAASIFMRTDAQQGTMTDIILGILGSIIGGFLFNMFGQPGVTGFNLYSFLVAIVGASVLIWLGRRFLYHDY